MSYSIIKSIAIQKDHVYVTSAASNISPRTFYRSEVPAYTELYQKEGLRPLLKEISKDVWEGNFKLLPCSKINEKILSALSAINSYPALRHFLDTEHGAEFLANTAVNYMENPYYAAAGAISKLEALRRDKNAVLDISEKNADAFHYAHFTVQENRDASKEYIERCGDKPFFSIPKAFRGDQELVTMSLSKNGCQYRELKEPLSADKDIIRLAFREDLPGRKYHEHLPDLIPMAVRKDKEFMQELIQLCPSLHIHRAKDILKDLETANTWVQKGNWVLNDLSSLPHEHLQDPIIQASLLNRFAEDRDNIAKIDKTFFEKGVNWVVPDPNEDVALDDEQQAYSLNNGEYYLAIQTCDDGYDYTIYYGDYSEYDGGQLDEPDFTMEEAIESILEDFELSELPRERCDYDDLIESADTVEQSRLNMARNLQTRPSLDQQISAAEGMKEGSFKEDPQREREPER